MKIWRRCFFVLCIFVFFSGCENPDAVSDADLEDHLEHPPFIADSIEFLHSGFNVTFFIDGSGTLYGAGSNGYGQLGTGLCSYKESEPVLVAGNVSAVDSGNGFTVFLDTEGNLWGMGLNTNGQLGRDDVLIIETPVKINREGESVVDFSAGLSHLLYLTDQGNLYGLGNNNEGQLGVDTGGLASSIPLLIASGVSSCATAGDSSFYITDINGNGHLYGFGSNNMGQFGLGYSVYPGRVPEPLLIADQVVDVSGSAARNILSGTPYLVFILKSSGDLYGAGYSPAGALGQGATNYSYSSREFLLIDSDVLSFDVQEDSLCYLKNDGNLWGTGSNQNYILGVPGNTGCPSPVSISGSVTRFAAGKDCLIIIREDNVILRFGNDMYGQLLQTVEIAEEDEL